MKRHFKTLTNSVITSTMQHQQDTNQLSPTKRLENQVSELLQRVRALETPTLMYRPPEGETHIKVAEYLDSVEERLRKLEANSHAAPRSNHGVRLTDIEARLSALSNRTPTVYLDDINTPSL